MQKQRTRRVAKAKQSPISSARQAIRERGQRLKVGHDHPGYIIGIHWLSVAYERICAGESEVSVMRDYGYHYIPSVRSAERYGLTE